MTDVSQRIAQLSPAKRALLEKRLAEVMAAKAGAAKIQHDEHQKPVPSLGQERLWLVEQFHGPSAQYNLGYSLRMEGTLDSAALQTALNALAERHQPLRTLLITSAGQLQTQVLPAFVVPLAVTDLRGRDAREREDYLSAALHAEVNRPFDMQRQPPFRAVLYRLGEREQVVQLTLHHAASDGWSTPILFRDFSALYSAAAKGVPAQLPELPITYSDFARWQREQLAGAEGERLISYWKKQLEGSSFALQLPTDRPRPALQTLVGRCRRYALSAALGSAIRDFCAREQVTPFMVLLAALDAVMARYSGQTDILIGSAVAARSRVETENLVGFFTNTIILRARLDRDPTFRELLHQARQTALDAYAHQDLPLQLLIEQLHAERDPSRSALFQVMLILQNVEKRRFDFHGLETRVRDMRNDAAKFDLLIEVIPSGESFDAEIEYNADLFEPGAIDRLWGHLSACLERAMESPETKVAAISILTAAETQQLAEWNATERPYPRERPLAALVEAQVERTPEAIAVVCGDRSLTYRELNSRANQLAHELLRQGAGPERIVGICLERSLEMVVALLAIVKSGGAYLPMDPRHPAKRIAYTLEDSGVQLLVTDKTAHAGLPAFAGKTIFVEDPGWRSQPDSNPGIAVDPEDLAYLLYTSGSTGNPKGVEIPCRALTNFLWCMREWLEITPCDRLLAVTTISFDIAGLEMWLPLVAGAQMVIATREQAADSIVLQSMLERHDITLLQATPVLWRLLFEAGWRGKANLQALCGGEAMPPELAARLVPAVKRTWNLYGPTETTIWSTGFEVRDGSAPISIGRPLANTQCYILDGRGNPLPAGIPGDLFIGGDGLARGYFNRPELTAERFVPDPFGAPGARMYKTGDSARFRPDGTIEFLGRNDQLVKIRGFRVELGEIEAALNAEPEISQAVVIAREDTPGEKRLVAYIVPATATPPAPSELRARLKLTLPEYSVPASYIFLDKIPVSPAGKVDRKALPAPNETNTPATEIYVAPRNRIEKILAEIWAGVLGVERIGVQDDFFELGGDSYQAARILVRVIAAVPGCQASLANMLKAPTVEKFARTLSGEHADWSCLVPVREGSQRLPFFCVPGVAGTPFNVMDLALALPSDLPFYCLQARGLDGQSAPHLTVEEAAEFNIELIRSVQAHGPYHLGGHCFGGLVAFEMARRLRAAGEEVGVVALIDTENSTYSRIFVSRPARMRAYLSFFLRRTLHHLANLVRVGPRGWRGFLAGRIHGLRFRLHPRNPIPKNEEELARIYEPVRYAGICAIRDFVPQPYDGRLLVFRAGRRRLDPFSEDTLGWRNLAQSVTTVEIEGDHLSMLSHPQVGAVADRLNRELQSWEPVRGTEAQAGPRVSALIEP